MLIELTEDEVRSILEYMYYGISKWGEIGNLEQNVYTKLYNHLKSNYEVPDCITKPNELTCYNLEQDMGKVKE